MLIKAISLVLFFEAILVQVNGVPLRVLGPQDGSPEDIARVKEATTDAHNLVTKMEAVHEKAAKGDKDSLAKIHKAFGDHANVNGVGENIQKLKDGKFKMEQAKDHNFAGQGYYDPGKNHVGVGSAFHSGTSAESRANRAGTIIHEASHAILGTKDIFDKHGEPTSRAKPTSPGDKVGYKDSHLPEMVHDPNFSKNLHQNADSWRVFGDLCRRELERRAFEEPDLMKRDEILQARAVACAMRPHKPTTPAKATGHDKGGKLTAHPGARDAKTLAHGKKSTVGKSLLKGGKQTLSHGVAKTRTKTSKSTTPGKTAGHNKGGKQTLSHGVAKTRTKLRKSTTPGKATGHGKGGKLTAHPGARGAKTPAHGRKSTGGKSLLKGGKRTPSHGVSKTRAKTTAKGGKVNRITKLSKAAAVFKKAATHTASKKSPSHVKLAKPAVKARRK